MGVWPGRARRGPCGWRPPGRPSCRSGPRCRRRPGHRPPRRAPGAAAWRRWPLPGGPRASGSKGPQWPWSVYSQRQTSAMVTRSGSASFSAFSAVQTGPSGSQAGVPCASFWAGDAEEDHRRDPAVRAARASSTNQVDRELRDPRHRAHGVPDRPCPRWAKSGRQRLRGSSVVSRTMARSAFGAPEPTGAVGGEGHAGRLSQKSIRTSSGCRRPARTRGTSSTSAPPCGTVAEDGRADEGSRASG